MLGFFFARRSGSVSKLNAALKTLLYIPGINYHGTDSITITVDDNGNHGSGGSRTATVTFVVQITSLNNAPAVVIPLETITAQEDSPLTITGIAFTDLDAHSGLHKVSISVTSGTVSLTSSTSVLKFTEGGNGQGSMQFLGSKVGMHVILFTSEQ